MEAIIYMKTRKKVPLKKFRNLIFFGVSDA